MTDPADPQPERSEFIRGPRWRVTAPAARRRTAALTTVAVMFVIGGAAMSVAMWLLALVDAPGWLVVAPWWLPTLGFLVWTLARPRPAVAAEDEQAWVTYAVLHVFVGPDTPRPAPARIVVAVLLGGPVVWALAIYWLLAIIGLADA